MAERERTFSPPAAGGVSLLTVFAVLCLTMFALLSLSTVQANGRLADASAQAVQDYYAADCKAQEYLAILRGGGVLPEDVTFTASVEHFDSRVEYLYSYSVPISDVQELQVEVRADEQGYEVLRWQAVPAGDWEPDEYLDLWDGEGFF